MLVCLHKVELMYKKYQFHDHPDHDIPWQQIQPIHANINHQKKETERNY